MRFFFCNFGVEQLSFWISLSGQFFKKGKTWERYIVYTNFRWCLSSCMHHQRNYISPGLHCLSNSCSGFSNNNCRSWIVNARFFATKTGDKSRWVMEIIWGCLWPNPTQRRPIGMNGCNFTWLKIHFKRVFSESHATLVSPATDSLFCPGGPNNNN